MAFPLLALLAAAQSAQQLTHKDQPQMLTPSAKHSQLPGASVGVVPNTFTPMEEASAQAMAPALPPSTSVPMNLLAAVRTDAQGNQPVLQALQQAGQTQQPSDLLSLLRSQYQPAQSPQQQKTPKRDLAAKPEQPPTQDEKAPSDGQDIAYNAAPGVQGNDVQQETTGVGKLKADASQGQTFMGLSGGEWGSIGQAAGVFANLMKKLPPLPTLTPGARGPGGIPVAPVGGDLYSAGAQRLGNASQFAINSPNADNASILRALHSASQVQ